MFWMFAGLAVCAAIVIAGRAHSRHLDKLDESVWLNPMNPPPDFAVVCQNCGAVGGRSDGEIAASSGIDHGTCGICNSEPDKFGGRNLSSRGGSSLEA